MFLNKMFLIAFISFFLFKSDVAYHDIHVSVCDIELEDKNIEVTLKTFLDDLQIAVGLTPGEELPEDYSSAEELIFELNLAGSSN